MECNSSPDTVQLPWEPRSGLGLSTKVQYLQHSSTEHTYQTNTMTPTEQDKTTSLYEDSYAQKNTSTLQIWFYSALVWATTSSWLMTAGVPFQSSFLGETWHTHTSIALNPAPPNHLMWVRYLTTTNAKPSQIPCGSPSLMFSLTVRSNKSNLFNNVTVVCLASASKEIEHPL